MRTRSIASLPIVSVRGVRSKLPSTPVLLLLVVWVISRAGLGWLTDAGEVGPYRGRAPAAHDIVLYDFWADRLGQDQRPYEDFGFEYPPANVVPIVAPQTVAAMGGWSYRPVFVASCVAVDALVLVGLLRLARRRSLLGATAWVVGIPLLGPVVFSRLDLIPAAAIVWLVSAAMRGRWGRAGAALGVAIGTKVFAGLVLPVTALLSPRRGVTIAAAAALVAIPFLPFLDIPDNLYDSLWGYHSRRGTEVGSIWSSLILLQGHAWGEFPKVELRSGGWEVVSSLSSSLKLLATLAVAAVTVDAAILASRRPRGDVRSLALLCASTITLTVALGNVVSPQYLVWCLAAMAAAATIVGDQLRWPVGLMLVACGLTHLIFPIYFWDLLFYQRVFPVVLTLVRDLLLIASGVLVLRVLGPRRAVPAGSEPAVEQQELVPAIPRDG